MSNTTNLVSAAFALAQKSYFRFKHLNGGVNPAAPCDTSDPDYSFNRFGLMAERATNGTMTCNIKVFGGLGAQPMPVIWQHPCHERLHLALTVVLKLTALPSDAESPLGRYFTKTFRKNDLLTETMNDGMRFQMRHMTIAQMFEKEYLATQNNADVLTIPVDTLHHAITKYIRQAYPD